jgi:hypothetical protein
MQSAYAQDLLELRPAHEYLGMFRVGDADDYPLTVPPLLQQNIVQSAKVEKVRDL